MNEKYPHRWIYRDQHNIAESAAYEAKLAQIDDFWKVFEGLVKSEKHKNTDLLLDTVLAELPTISPDMRWEFGPNDEGGYTFALTPDSDFHLRPLVQTMIERAPVLDGIRYTTYREPHRIDDLKDLLLSRVRRFLPGMRVNAMIGKRNAIDLKFAAAQFSNDNATDDLNYCFAVCETLLGQEDLERWTGIIEPIVGVPNKLPDTVDLVDFPNLFARLKQKIIDGLPTVPIAQIPDTGGGLFKFKSGERMTCQSRLPEIMAASFFCASGLAIERFSQFDETICYLKIDESASAQDADNLDRGELEEIFDCKLREAGCGSTLGGGWGPVYNFIDLALTDVERSIPILRDVALETKLSKRSWLLFYDAGLSHEWVGLYADSPAPPFGSAEPANLL